MPSSLTLYRAVMLPSTDLGNVTSETQFLDGRGILPLQLQLPSNGSLSNRSFRIRLSGRVATTTNTTFEMRVYFGISATIASNKLMFDSAAQTVNNVTSNFLAWIDCQWTADGKLIAGWVSGQLANNMMGPQTLNNTPINADPAHDNNPSGVTYGFTVTGVFGGSSTGNHAFVDNFDLESL